MKTMTLAIGCLTLAAGASTANGRPEHGAGERPDPEELVISIVSEFDTNTDNLINVTELEAALKGMHEKRSKMRSESAEEGDPANKPPRRLGPSGGNRNRPDPATLAGRLIEKFDVDDDEALNTEELLEAFGSLHKGPRGPRGPRGHHRGEPDAEE